MMPKGTIYRIWDYNMGHYLKKPDGGTWLDQKTAQLFMSDMVAMHRKIRLERRLVW